MIESSSGNTQGHPVAMYVPRSLRLQDILQHEHTEVKQVTDADNTRRPPRDKITDRRKWRGRVVCGARPGLGYFPNAVKSVLIVKPEIYEMAKAALRGSEAAVRRNGTRHLSAVSGTLTQLTTT